VIRHVHFVGFRGDEYNRNVGNGRNKMATFTMENTDGYTPEELVQFNIEEDAILAGIEPGSVEYHDAVQAFQHEMSRRVVL